MLKSLKNFSYSVIIKSGDDIYNYVIDETVNCLQEAEADKYSHINWNNFNEGEFFYNSDGYGLLVSHIDKINNIVMLEV